MVVALCGDSVLMGFRSMGFFSPVVIHSDHCAAKLLPWFDGMLEADEAYFAINKEPLFSYVLFPPNRHFVLSMS